MKRLSLLALAALSLMPHYAMAVDSPPSNTDKVVDFALEKLQSAFSAAEKAMPVVTEKVLEVTSLGCSVELIWGLAPFAVFLFGVYLFCRFFNRMREVENKNHTLDSRYHKDWTDPEIYGVISGFVAAGSAIALVITVAWVIRPWMWVCVYHPDIYLIHQAIEKVVN